MVDGGKLLFYGLCGAWEFLFPASLLREIFHKRFIVSLLPRLAYSDAKSSHSCHNVEASKLTYTTCLIKRPPVRFSSVFNSHTIALLKGAIQLLSST